MSKLTFGLCENKGADQLHSNCKADQHLCFYNTDNTIPPLPNYKISLVCVGPGRIPQQ